MQGIVRQKKCDVDRVLFSLRYTPMHQGGIGEQVLATVNWKGQMSFKTIISQVRYSVTNPSLAVEFTAITHH